jgi:hypothetical protein
VFRIDRSDDGVHSATLVRGAAEQILPEMVAMLADPGSG